MSDRKIYSEKEATDIVLRAAKLQEEIPDDEEESYVPGLTLEELIRMAKELGVEEKYLHKVLESKQNLQGEDTQNKHLGVTWSTEIERIIDGELPPENFDIIIEEMSVQNSFRTRRVGMQRSYAQPVQVGRSLQGPVQVGMSMGKLKMTSRNGRTRLTVKTNPFIPIMAILYPAFMFGFIPTVILLAQGAVNPLLILPIVAIFWAIAWIIFSYVQNTGQQSMVEKVDQIAAKIADENESLRDNLEKPTLANETSEPRQQLNVED